jgi:hypothetical protein
MSETTKTDQARKTARLVLQNLVSDIQADLDKDGLPFPDSLAKRLNDYAESYGALRLLAAVEGLDDQQQKDKAVALVLNGPDDGWSGRSNDVRRAQYDGLRRYADEIIRGY